MQLHVYYWSWKNNYFYFVIIGHPSVLKVGKQIRVFWVILIASKQIRFQ